MTILRVLSLARPTVVACVLACLGVFAVPSDPAHAQVQIAIESSDGDGAMTPIASQSFDDYAQILGLNVEQQAAGRELYEGYRAQLRAAQEDNQAKMSAVQEKSEDGAGWRVTAKEMQRTIEEYAKRCRQIEDQFLGDFKQLLAPAQLEKWDAVERHRRREVGLWAQDFSGAGVDLLRLVRRAGIESAETSAVLEQYELELDRLLREWSETNQRERVETDDGVVSFEVMQERMRTLGAISRRVRDLNTGTLRRLEAVWTPEQFESLLRSFRERAHPRVYRRSLVEQQLDAALGFDDLDGAQRRQLEELRAGYVRDAAPINDAWARAIEASEEQAGSSALAMMGRFMMGEDRTPNPANDHADEARKNRLALESRTQDRLKELLSEPQRARLPAKKRDTDDESKFHVSIGVGGFVGNDDDR